MMKPHRSGRRTKRKKRKHVLGGRTFIAVRNSTVEQDLFFERARREAGLDELAVEPDETGEQFAMRLLDTVVRSGKLLTLLGTLLMPEEAIPRKFPARTGETWTPEMAEETALHIGALQGSDEKAKVRILVLELLVAFFENGTVSLWTTETSSVPTTVPEDTRSLAETDTATGAHSS